MVLVSLGLQNFFAKHTSTAIVIFQRRRCNTLPRRGTNAILNPIKVSHPHQINIDYENAGTAMPARSSLAHGSLRLSGDRIDSSPPLVVYETWQQECRYKETSYLLLLVASEYVRIGGATVCRNVQISGIDRL